MLKGKIKSPAGRAQDEARPQRPAQRCRRSAHCVSVAVDARRDGYARGLQRGGELCNTKVF